MFTINNTKISDGSFRVFNISKEGLDIYKDDFLIFSFCSNKKIKIKNSIINIEECSNKICDSQLSYICFEHIKNNNVLVLGLYDSFLSNLTKNIIFLNDICLSKRPMVQKDDMILPCHIEVEGYKRLEIIDFETLESKHFKIDTLISTTKNALFYILCDFPDILKNINLIIFKNNFTEIQKYNFVIKKLENFERIDYETIPEKYEIYRKLF